MGALAELEFDHNLFATRRAGDEKLFVVFYNGVVPDQDASAASGSRKFRDVEMVRIIVPGDKRNIVDREVREDDRDRFATQYKRFQESGEQSAVGFPLKEWSLVTRAMVEELRWLGFTTVEQVAQASDGIASKHPGFRELQKRATTWLEAQASAAPLERLQNELEKRDEQLAAMQAQINQLLGEQSKKKV